jgi:NitT/TauT family transport system ATP-binding protein
VDQPRFPDDSAGNSLFVVVAARRVNEDGVVSQARSVFVDHSPPLINCRELNKSYSVRVGEPVVALKNLNIQVPTSDFVVVVGPSGCGKTTFLRLLAGLETKTTGAIELGGIPIVGPRKDIGIVFQSPTLLAWRSVIKNIMLPIDVLGLSRSAHLGRAEQLIEMVGLRGFEDKYPWELSGGMQQRVAICRSLIHQPRLLLMDEPFGALDAFTRESMNIELEKIWLTTRQTILLITHSIPEAVFLATRVAVISSRPGTIADVVSVELPRPRTLDMTTLPKFGDHVRHIRNILNQASASPTLATNFETTLNAGVLRG